MESEFILLKKNYINILEILSKKPRSFSELKKLTQSSTGGLFHNLSKLKKAGFIKVKEIEKSRGKRINISLNNKEINLTIKKINNKLKVIGTKIYK